MMVIRYRNGGNCEKERAPSPKWGEGKGFKKYLQLNDEACSFVQRQNQREEGLKKKIEGAGGIRNESKRAMTGSRGKMAGARFREQKHRRDVNAFLAVRCYVKSSWLPSKRARRWE